jgi:hypothetical protein
MIVLSLKNVSPTRLHRYNGALRLPTKSPHMTDEFANEYYLETRIGNNLLERPALRAARHLDPGMETSDQLIFRKPIAQATELSLIVSMEFLGFDKTYLDDEKDRDLDIPLVLSFKRSDLPYKLK